MWDTQPRKVLVAVDATDCEAALEYAVAEARRRGCGIHVVHVARHGLGLSSAVDDVRLIDGELRLSGHAELGAAVARMEALLDELAPGDDRLSVSSELTHGSVVAALAGLSRHAGLLVMEHQGMGESGESVTLSVTAGTAAVAHCPVVAVPVGWRLRDGAESADVVVGVEDPERDRLLLQTALHEAARRHTRMRVVRAPVPGAVDPAGVLQFEDSDVPVDVVVEDGPADQVLLRHAHSAALLVIGRHHRKHLVGAPLGRTARSLLRHASIPVLVVDPVVGDGLVPSSASGLAGLG